MFPVSSGGPRGCPCRRARGRRRWPSRSRLERFLRGSALAMPCNLPALGSLPELVHATCRHSAGAQWISAITLTAYAQSTRPEAAMP